MSITPIFPQFTKQTIVGGLISQKNRLRGRKILTKGQNGDWSNWMYEDAP